MGREFAERLYSDTEGEFNKEAAGKVMCENCPREMDCPDYVSGGTCSHGRRAKEMGQPKVAITRPEPSDCDDDRNCDCCARLNDPYACATCRVEYRLLHWRKAEEAKKRG
jgi:hypothetical protein